MNTDEQVILNHHKEWLTAEVNKIIDINQEGIELKILEEGFIIKFQEAIAISFYTFEKAMKVELAEKAVLKSYYNDVFKLCRVSNELLHLELDYIKKYICKHYNLEEEGSSIELIGEGVNVVSGEKQQWLCKEGYLDIILTRG